MAPKSTKRKKSTVRKSKKGQEGTALGQEIIILAIFAACILLVISNFGWGGIVGEILSSVIFGLFGFMAYFVPFIFFGVTAFIISNRGNRQAYIKAGAMLVLVLVLTAFMELIINAYNPDTSLWSYYQMSAGRRNAGGILGGLTVKLLCPLIGVAGAYVVVVILTVICVIVVTERSLLAPLTRGGKKAYEDARRKQEAAAQRRVQRQEKKEAAAQRQERKVAGVSFATTLTEDKVPARKSPEVKELTPDLEEVTTGSVTSPLEDLVIKRDETREGNVEELVPPVEKVPEQEVPSEKKAGSTKGTQSVAAETLLVEESIQAQEGVSKPVYKLPPLSLLNKGKKAGGDSDAHLRATALKLEQTLQNFGVQVHVTNASCGPSVTRYEIQPEQGVKVSKIVGLADDIKLNLAVTDLRIEAPIPGKAAVGIEVPNSENTAVMLRDLLESNEFKNNKSGISFAVGKDISGKVTVADIAKMPHLLVAGATGSGKSVCINTLIMSILYKAGPEDVKLIMIDPKVVELSVYNGIPHLLIPVVTDPKKAAGALNWAVAEMEKRYKLFAEYNVRDLKGFNEKVAHLDQSEETPSPMPQIVIIVDELADLMMVAPGEVEGAICRLAQLARAAGLHLILATQRPSVNVITGLIKANMPSRIAFSVSSGVDSRTIIDMNGAEKLLGKGDMLFYPTGYPKPVRVQGSFVSDKEVQKVVEHLIKNSGNVSYNEEVEEHVNSNVSSAATGIAQAGAEDKNERDAYFAEAGKLIIDKDKASIGMLQRMFKIGFNRAARIMDQLAEAGIVGEEEGTKPRKILMTEEEFEQYIEENV